jgi:hypothetical protein
MAISQVVPDPEKQKANLEAVHKNVHQPAFKMLKAKGVPFDPNLLLQEDWRTLIEPALAQMPEMKTTIHAKDAMKGVYLADTLLLPEHIKLAGETVILVRELSPEDENKRITIEGDYLFVIYVIEDNKQFAAMAKNGGNDILNIYLKAPCAIVGIAPIYMGTYRCQGWGQLIGGMRR